MDLEKTAFDIDGVVVDIVTPFLRRLADRHGYTGLTYDDVTSFDLVDALGVPPDVVRELVDELLDHPLEVEARPYPGAAQVLAGLIEQAPLLFVTARPSAGPIAEWFRLTLPELPVERIEIVPTGDPMKKLECLRDHGRRHFIDDHLDTCRMLDQAGLDAFVFDQPWNRRDQTLRRLHGWDEVAVLFNVR
ncbi:MAG: hypothetical protein KKB20_09355 [Proteobacteria bacterium]|nr:hypothetical protein [Pseudomonadota bacterium]